jgi:hypothetical protein
MAAEAVRGPAKSPINGVEHAVRLARTHRSPARLMRTLARFIFSHERTNRTVEPVILTVAEFPPRNAWASERGNKGRVSSFALMNANARTSSAAPLPPAFTTGGHFLEKMENEPPKTRRKQEAYTDLWKPRGS